MTIQDYIWSNSKGSSLLFSGSSVCRDWDLDCSDMTKEGCDDATLENHYYNICSSGNVDFEFKN